MSHDIFFLNQKMDCQEKTLWWEIRMHRRIISSQQLFDLIILEQTAHLGVGNKKLLHNTQRQRVGVANINVQSLPSRNWNEIQKPRMNTLG